MNSEPGIIGGASTVARDAIPASRNKFIYPSAFRFQHFTCGPAQAARTRKKMVALRNEQAQNPAMAIQKKKPSATDVRPITKTGIDRVIEKLKQMKCRFPLSRVELYEKYSGIAGYATMRELARRGMLVDSELWDGSLPDGIAQALEWSGVTSRADFRQKYLAGELVINQWRNFGKHKRAQVLTWAGLPVPDDGRRDVTFHLDFKTCQKLDTLVKQRGLHSRDELIAQLAADA